MIGGRVENRVAPLAGESALARYTMLAMPRIETRAILSVRWKRLEKKLALAPASAFEDEQIEVQTWTYDLQILTQADVIDRLSLYLSVRENPDERIVQTAEEYWIRSYGDRDRWFSRTIHRP